MTQDIGGDAEGHGNIERFFLTAHRQIGQIVGNIVCLDETGRLDPDFHANSGTGLDGEVHGIAISGEVLYLVGLFLALFSLKFTNPFGVKEYP